MSQGSLFGPDNTVTAKPTGGEPQTLRILITVKAAPNPSTTYGETVCVAGLSLDPTRPGWIRLYPINFRELESDNHFKKYDVVTVRAKPAHPDPRVESWRPEIHSLQREKHLNPWAPRRTHVEPYIGESMCDVLQAVRANPPARSLAAVRPARVEDIDVMPHPGWTDDELAKIDQYVSQIDLFGSERTALEAPRMRGWYKYRCHNEKCPGHRQGIIDWEFVALQRRLSHYDDASLAAALRTKFHDELCAPNRNVAFYVGNQAKRPHVFSVLGVYYPPH